MVAAAATSWGREVAAGGGAGAAPRAPWSCLALGGHHWSPVTFPCARVLLFGRYQPCRGERRRNGASAAPRREFCQFGGWEGDGKVGQSWCLCPRAVTGNGARGETCHFSSPALAEPCPGSRPPCLPLPQVVCVARGAVSSPKIYCWYKTIKKPNC